MRNYDMKIHPDPCRDDENYRSEQMQNGKVEGKKLI